MTSHRHFNKLIAIYRMFYIATKENRKTESEIRSQHESSQFTFFFLLFTISAFVVPVVWTWGIWVCVAVSIIIFAMLCSKLYASQYHHYDMDNCCPSCEGSGFKRAYKFTITSDQKGFRQTEKHLGYFPCNDSFHEYSDHSFRVLGLEDLKLLNFEMSPAYYSAILLDAKESNDKAT